MTSQGSPTDAGPGAKSAGGADLESAPPFGWTGGQFSLLRAVLGLTAASMFLWLVIDPELAGAALGRVELPWLTRGFGALGVAAAIALALGASARPAAFVAAGLWAAAFGIDLRGAQPGLFTAVLLGLALHDPKPLGSLDARARVDPAGGWRREPWLHAVLFGLLLSATIATLTDLWLSGSALAAQGGIVALARLAGIGFSLRPRTRPVAFTALLLAELTALLPGAPAPTPWSLALLALCFEPDWIAPKPPPESEVVYFDGNCGLCHGAVRFLSAEDGAAERFLYAPLCGPTFEERVPTDRRAGLPDSIVLQTNDGALLTQSSAVLHALARLGGLWRPLAGLSSLVPRPLRDLVYAGIARVRKRVFATPPEACPLLPPDLRGRFLA